MAENKVTEHGIPEETAEAVADDLAKSEKVEGEHIEGEQVEGEQAEGEYIEGEHVEGEQIEGEQVEGEHVEGEQIEGEHVEGEQLEGEHIDGEHLEGEQLEGEQLEGKEGEGVEEKEDTKADEIGGEEEEIVEEPPPDPAAPLDLTDSKELLRPKFELRPEQLAEVEKLWELYQNYTPAYTDIEGYITEKELVYLLKSLLLMTYTEEQLQELIVFCVRPPHPEGHITYDQFLKMVIIRQRDFPIEEELRAAFEVMDPEKTGQIEREYLKDVLRNLGSKMNEKQLGNLITEIDMTNDGQIGIVDAVGTMCIDLNKDDIIMLMDSLNLGNKEQEEEDI